MEPIALSLYLGHADPGFTLRVYTHLLPASGDRTRRAVDRAFGYVPDADGLATAEVAAAMVFSQVNSGAVLTWR